MKSLAIACICSGFGGNDFASKAGLLLLRNRSIAALLLDFSTHCWYTRQTGVGSKPLKTLRFGEGHENPSLSANSLSQPIDFIGLSLEQIEAIPHSVPHLLKRWILCAENELLFQKNQLHDERMTHSAGLTEKQAGD